MNWKRYWKILMNGSQSRQLKIPNLVTEKNFIFLKEKKPYKIIEIIINEFLTNLFFEIPDYFYALIFKKKVRKDITEISIGTYLTIVFEVFSHILCTQKCYLLTTTLILFAFVV